LDTQKSEGPKESEVSDSRFPLPARLAYNRTIVDAETHDFFLSLEMLINHNPKYLITFVHGTWGRNSPWTQTGSHLHKLLSDHYGEDSIRNFEWSGSNSHKARLKAGKRLSRALKNSINSYPQAKHFVISHSHGGNVVLYALRDEQLQQQLSGIMCMGTPFIHCQPREISESLGVISYLFSFFRFLLGAYLLVGLIFNPPSSFLSLLKISDGAASV
jgi:hypothetical protein